MYSHNQNFSNFTGEQFKVLSSKCKREYAGSWMLHNSALNNHIDKSIWEDIDCEICIRPVPKSHFGPRYASVGYHWGNEQPVIHLVVLKNLILKLPDIGKRHEWELTVWKEAREILIFYRSFT